MLSLCSICGGEFETGAVICAVCGCRLVPSALSENAVGSVVRKEKTEIEFIELCRPWNYPEAMLVKETLEQNGVAVLIQGTHSLSIMPHLVFGGQLRVLVDRSQLEYARDLFKAYFESDEETNYVAEE